jgi:hypothetical protein
MLCQHAELVVGKKSSIWVHHDHSVAGKWDRASEALAKDLRVSSITIGKTFQAHEGLHANPIKNRRAQHSAQPEG